MFKLFKKYINFKENRELIILYIVLPIIINLIIEMLARKSPVKGLVYMFTSPYVFLCNTLIILFTMSFTLLFRRRLFSIAVIGSIWLIFGVINFVLLTNRVTPFGAPDFKNIADGIMVMGSYLNMFTLIIAILLIVGVIAGITFIWLKVPRIKGKMNHIKNIVLIAVIAVITFGALNIGLAAGSLSTKLPELSTSYAKYGFVYCFSNSVVNTGVNRPSDYSKGKINDIINMSQEETTNVSNIVEQDTAGDPNDVNNVTKKPNIIIVQLESFFDITEVNNLNFTEDPIPNYHRLMKEWASGYLDMPAVGAGTANSEFEVLTGMNLDHFGPGEYPYKTILKTANCESISYNLKEYGYTAQALHNNTGGFYGRNNVFSQLGFDTFTSVEYMQNVAKTLTGNWAKDEILVEQIELALDSTNNQDFVYAISVQGHGSYPASGEFDTEIQITSETEDESRINAMEYYTQQIHEMDQFVANLITMLEARDEESIVVFYGDHLPSFGLSDKDVKSGSIYKTPYFIWNNCDLKYTDEDIEAYQLQSKILKELNMTAGVINKYHQEYIGTEEYLNGLQNLEYDILYGDLLVYNGINPYQPTKLQMGIKEIKITQIYKDSEKVNAVIIKGENFTTYSKVFVNGDYFENTEFIDSNTLRIEYAELKGLDSFVVSQAHSATSILSSTKENLYYGE